MAQIEVIRDPNIDQSEIVMILEQPSSEQMGEPTYNPTDIVQTKVFGILMPLISLNGIAVDYHHLIKFSLDDTKTLPSVEFEFIDRDNMLKRYSQPGNDNILRVQLIPSQDNTYKKIDLTFLCTDITIKDGVCKGEAVYNVPKFTQSQYKSFGSVNTFELLDKISLETGLGYASNVGTTQDSRYIVCNYESYKDVINREIQKSGSDETHVYDWWVDCWNNIVLCDIYDRVNSMDSEEQMNIWVTGNYQEATENGDSVVSKTPAIFSNHPMMENTDLWVFDFDVDNSPITPSRGNIFAVSAYEENKHECINHYIADGDIQKNDFIKYEYLGEVYGDYNYLIAEKARNVYMSKVKSEVIVLHLATPQFGIARGSQCRFVWYDNDSQDAFQQDTLESLKLLPTQEQAAEYEGWLKDFIPEKEDTNKPMKINMQFSGQYTSIGQYITYSIVNQKWDCWLYLVRPASKRPKMIQNATDSGQ